MEQENYKKVNKLQSVNLNFLDYEYVINHCRHVDLMEIMLMGYTRMHLIKRFDSMNAGVIGRYLKTPVCAAGTQIIDQECWYWFLGTPLANDFFIQITRESEKFISKSIKKYPNLKHVVQVWSKHTQSVEWLNMLKFAKIASYNQGDEQIFIMERKRI